MIVDRVLAGRVEQAIVAERTAFAEGIANTRPDSGAGWQDVAGGRAIFTAPDLFTNRAVGVGMDGPLGAADLEVVAAFYRDRCWPPEVELGPLADPSALPALVAAGYQPRRFRNIYASEVGSLGKPERGVNVVRVEQGLPFEWSEALLDGFGYQSPPDRCRVATWNAMVWSLPGVTGFGAAIDGQPAGAASVMVVDGVAVLGGAATRPTWRRHGVQQALIAARLAWAAQEGCDLAVVTADPGGSSARNAERLGFGLVYNHLALRLPTGATPG